MRGLGSFDPRSARIDKLAGPCSYPFESWRPYLQSITAHNLTNIKPMPPTDSIPALQTRLFKNEKGPEPGPTITLQLGEDFAWHKERKSECNHPDRTGVPLWVFRFFEGISNDFTDLVGKDGGLFSHPDAACILQDQPMWDVKDPLNDLPDKPAERIGEAQPAAGDWRMEYLAFYLPAHLHGINNYGIYLPAEGVAKAVNEIETLNAERGISSLNREDLILAVTFTLFAHEMCHAWIEDICCLLDGQNPTPVSKEQRRYARIHRRFTGYIFMEEAICNTAAYAWLHHFLSCESEAPHNLDILRSIEAWMRTQPKGYDAFHCLDEEPHTSEVFKSSVSRLLFEIYGIENPAPTRMEVESVVKDYFTHAERPACFGKFPLYACNQDELRRRRYNDAALRGIDPDLGFHDLLDVL